MKSNKQVFKLNELKVNDILFLSDEHVGIIVGDNLVDIAGRKMFIHEVEQKILKVKRKKCTLASRISLDEPMCKEPDYRKKVRSVYYHRHV